MKKRILIFYIILIAMLIFPLYKIFSEQNYNIDNLKYISEFEKIIDKKYKFSIKEYNYNKEIILNGYNYFIKSNVAFLEEKKSFSVKLINGYIKSYKNKNPLFFAKAQNILYDNAKLPRIIYLQGDSDLILYGGKFVIHAEKIIFNFENNNIYLYKNIHIVYDNNYEISGDNAILNIKKLLFKINGNVVLDTFDSLILTLDPLFKTNFFPLKIRCENVYLDFIKKKYLFKKKISITGNNLDIIADYLDVFQNKFKFKNINFNYNKDKFNKLKINGKQVILFNVENDSIIQIDEGDFLYIKKDFIFSNTGKYANSELKFFNDKVVLYESNFKKSSIKLKNNDKVINFTGDKGIYRNNFKDITLYLKEGNFTYKNKTLNYISSGKDLHFIIENYKIKNRSVLSFNYYKDKNREIYFEAKKGNFDNNKILKLKGNVRYKDFKNKLAISSDYFKVNFNTNDFISKDYVRFYFFKDNIDSDWHFNDQTIDKYTTKYNVSIFAKCNKIVYNYTENKMEFRNIKQFVNLKDKNKFKNGKLIWERNKNFFKLKNITEFNSQLIGNLLNNINFSYGVLKNNGTVLEDIKNLKTIFGKKLNYSIKINNGKFNLTDILLTFKEFNFKLLNKNLFIAGDQGKINFNEKKVLFKKIYNFRINGKRIITDEINIDFSKNIIKYTTKENDFSMDIE